MSSAGTTTPVLDGYAEKADNNLTPFTVIAISSPERQSLDDVEHPFDADKLIYLHRWLKIAWAILAVIIAVTWLLWPMPLYRDYVFSKSFFSGWIVVAIIWQFFALFAVVLYPLYDGREDLFKSLRGIWKSLQQKYKTSA